MVLSKILKKLEQSEKEIKEEEIVKINSKMNIKEIDKILINL